MTITVKNKTIVSTDVSNFETAWPIGSALLVLEHLEITNQTVLGGDILTNDLERNYDSWYYNEEANIESQFNVKKSIDTAREYISKYIQTNGNSFYVIFTTR